MAELGGPYKTCDAAALRWSQKNYHQSHTQEWQKYEYGFFVLGLPGEEGKGLKFYYTKPHTDGNSIGVTPPFYNIALAFCHTHPKPSTFSNPDFNTFKKLRALTAKHKLPHNIVFYLMDGSRPVRRSNSEKNFF